MQVDDNGVFTIQKQEKLFPRARYKLQYRILTRYAVGKLHIAESAAPLFILRPLQIYTVSRSVVRKVSAGALQLELDQLTTLLLIENENVASDVAEQLSRINEQLAIKNRRSRRIWKIVAIILAVIVLVNIFIAVFFSVPDLNSNT